MMINLLIIIPEKGDKVQVQKHSFQFNIKIPQHNTQLEKLPWMISKIILKYNFPILNLLSHDCFNIFRFIFLF